jgi:hypothetical protein
MSKSSLRDYITFYRHKEKQPYLEDMRDFEESRLKLNAGHNKRKCHTSSTTLQSHREHLLLLFKLILFSKLFKHSELVRQRSLSLDSSKSLISSR